jgi:hypothetical protein
MHFGGVHLLWALDQLKRRSGRVNVPVMFSRTSPRSAYVSLGIQSVVPRVRSRIGCRPLRICHIRGCPMTIDSQRSVLQIPGELIVSCVVRNLTTGVACPSVKIARSQRTSRTVSQTGKDIYGCDLMLGSPVITTTYSIGTVPDVGYESQNSTPIVTHITSEGGPR